MQILSINTTTYQNKQLSFGSSIREVFNTKNQLLYRTTTHLFRRDFPWRKLPEFLENEFHTTDKVTIIDHACSTGEEAYSIAAILIDKLGEKAKKYLPIIAKDYDEENILAVIKNDKIPIDMPEGSDIRFHLSDVSKFGNIIVSKVTKYGLLKEGYFQPNNILRNNINFSRGNIFDDIYNMPEHNTLLLCRNFWPYLSQEDRELLMSKISEKFDNTCCVAIGGFDEQYSNVLDLFDKYGFQKTSLYRVYRKK